MSGLGQTSGEPVPFRPGPGRGGRGPVGVCGAYVTNTTVNILLTNDDSHISPLLALVIEALRGRGTLTIVVPKHEQSWRGKSMTRFENLHLEELTIAGEPAFTVDGTPADCVNLALHHIVSSRPDVVVSGINAGLNTGAGFILASGTIGACLEANIAGIPGIALSQGFDSATMNQYAAEYALPVATIARLRAQALPLLTGLFDRFAASAELRTRPITWNVNFPFEADPAARLMPARVGRTTYGSIFARTEIHFEHRLREVHVDPAPDTDAGVLRSGHASVTPLDIFSFGQLESSAHRDLVPLLAAEGGTP